MTEKLDPNNPTPEQLARALLRRDTTKNKKSS
jgi:hypothetical protein